MLDDLKKSLNQIIYERTSSPFYGSLIVSWLIWNWRIVYLTFIISENKIEKNKIDFILEHYADTNHIIVFPLLSTIIILTVIPFISNGAYWLSLRFNKWKTDQKNTIDKKQLLTVEQSLEIREEISRQEDRFAKLIESKNTEISQLKLQIDEYVKKTSNIVQDTTKKSSTELSLLVERIKNNKDELKQYNQMETLMQSGYQITDRSDILPKFITLLESYDIIENKGSGTFIFTTKGKDFQRMML